MQDVWEPFQGSDLLNALTPERGTPQQLPKVRTLGWDSLAIDYTFLCKAVADPRCTKVACAVANQLLDQYATVVGYDTSKRKVWKLRSAPTDEGSTI